MKLKRSNMVRISSIRQINPIFTGRARRGMVFCDRRTPYSSSKEEPWHNKTALVNRNKTRSVIIDLCFCYTTGMRLDVHSLPDDPTELKQIIAMLSSSYQDKVHHLED
jgi:hypothetical protein